MFSKELRDIDREENPRAGLGEWQYIYGQQTYITDKRGISYGTLRAHHIRKRKLWRKCGGEELWIAPWGKRFVVCTSFHFFHLGFSFKDTGNLQDSKGRERTSLILYTTSTCSRLFKRHSRWLLRTFNHSAHNYQTATQFHLRELAFACMSTAFYLRFNVGFSNNFPQESGG